MSLCHNPSSQFRAIGPDPFANFGDKPARFLNRLPRDGIGNGLARIVGLVTQRTQRIEQLDARRIDTGGFRKRLNQELVMTRLARVAKRSIG